METAIVSVVYGANAVVLLLGFFVGVRKKRLYSVVWGALLVFHVTSLNISGSLFGEFTYDTLLRGQLLMLIANCLLLSSFATFDSMFLRTITNFEGVQAWLTNPSLSKRRYLTLMVLLSIAIIGLLLRDGLGRLSIGWEEARESTGVIDSMAILLSFIVFPSVWVAFRTKRYLLSLLLGMLCLSIFQIIGSRAALLTLLAAVYAELLLTGQPLRKKIGVLLAVGMLGFTLHALSRATRGLGFEGVLAILTGGNLLEWIKVLWSQIDLSGGESNIYHFYNYVIDKSYEGDGYRAWVTLKRLVLIYVPTWSLPDIKPVDITYKLYADAFADGLFNETPYFTGIADLMDAGQSGSIHPTIWGDAYVNGGMAGILVYPVLFGFVLVLIEKCVRRLTPVGLFMLAPLTIVGYAFVARGNVVIGFGYLAYIIPMALLLAYAARLQLMAAKGMGRHA